MWSPPRATAQKPAAAAAAAAAKRRNAADERIRRIVEDGHDPVTGLLRDLEVIEAEFATRCNPTEFHAHLPALRSWYKQYAARHAKRTALDTSHAITKVQVSMQSQVVAYKTIVAATLFGRGCASFSVLDKSLLGDIDPALYFAGALFICVSCKRNPLDGILVPTLTGKSNLLPLLLAAFMLSLFIL